MASLLETGRVAQRILDLARDPEVIPPDLRIDRLHRIAEWLDKWCKP